MWGLNVFDIIALTFIAVIVGGVLGSCYLDVVIYRTIKRDKEYIAYRKEQDKIRQQEILDGRWLDIADDENDTIKKNKTKDGLAEFTSDASVRNTPMSQVIEMWQYGGTTNATANVNNKKDEVN